MRNVKPSACFLYHERSDVFVAEIANSISGLVKMEGTRFVLTYNIAHPFLPSVYELILRANERSNYDF